MQLVHFTVQNFRSITTAYRLPIRQETILIGPNNEGKSNILRALVTALEVLGLISGLRPRGRHFRSYARTTSLYDWSRDFPITLQEANPDGASVFRVEFQLTANEIAEFEAEVGSSLNGTLPIELRLRAEGFGFVIRKRGPGAKHLTLKRDQIATFVAKRIDICYIPAVRTAQSAQEIVSDLVARELAAAETDPAYRAAVAEVARIQAPILDRVSRNIGQTLRQFLPSVSSVRIAIPDEARSRALRRACEIVVDDGSATDLATKGDGVQSLAALSIMRHASESTAGGRTLVLAIEEPESHLHPNAVHQLKLVLADIACRNQVIMTTHCPVFVDRASLRSNLVVYRGKAAPAASMAEIRTVLGVRASDNLLHAELILLVEGEEDRRALGAILRNSSPALSKSLDLGQLALDSLLGGGNLAYKAGEARAALCFVHAFLDGDKSGKAAADRAQSERLLEPAEITFATCLGLKEAELEDLYDETLYAERLQTRWGVTLVGPKPKDKGKWSDRMGKRFNAQGKAWNERVEADVKWEIAGLAAENPSKALNAHRRGPIESLVAALEQKIASISSGRAAGAGLAGPPCAAAGVRHSTGRGGGSNDQPVSSS